MRKKMLVAAFLAAVFMTVISVEISLAQLGGQVFYKFGVSSLKDDRGGEVFTDAMNATGAGANDDDGGRVIAAGLDIPLTKLLGNTLLGEVMVEYAKFSDKEVLQTTSALDVVLAGEGGVKSVTTSAVNVSELIVVVAPKYRFELGKLRPWIIPAGLAFMVNSPPSDDTTYLDTGFHYGIGVEYMVHPALSVGADYRNTIASGDPGIKASYSSYGVYIGINF